MTIITLDTETFYDKTYSLSRMTTEEYIRDPRFQIIGVSTKVDDAPAQWFSGTHRQIKDYLLQFDWGRSALLAQNTLFDAAILSWRLGIRPKVLLDTMSMARALHGPDASASLKALAERYGVGVKGDEVLNAIGKRRDDFSPAELARYGQYCVNDTELCRKLFDLMSADFPKSELKLIDLTLKMFTEPVLELDKPHLEQHLVSTKAVKEALLAKVAVDKKELMSNPKFASLLESFGVEVPMKTSPTTGQETYAFAKTDEGLKALAEHPDVRVQALVAARLGNKSTLEETRTQRFIDMADRGAFPIPLKYYAAHTGRWGGCLVADTKVVVLDKNRTIRDKAITEVLDTDLVWDGVEFVAHEGVVFSGYAEVIEWDGITGTEDHVVFTNAGEISLRDALQGGHPVQVARRPDQNDVDAVREHSEAE